ncbi:MAG: hypothetical protein R6U67_03020 [Sodalinema sp.]|nr:MAG: hypothetical protein EYR95_11010 [Phormidium sp. SL48-SHIP]
MKPSYTSHRDRIANHYVKAANSMTLPTSDKPTRESFILYGAWTILILSMLAMIVPTANIQSSFNSRNSETVESVKMNLNSN